MRYNFYAVSRIEEGQGMMTKQAQVMVITPHPDDAEFGVAGTVARWVREGKSFVYVVCSSGEKAPAIAT